MTTIKLIGKALTANRDERTISGLLLPFGEVGYTSAGAITASAGAVTLPEDPSSVHLNLEHDPLRPVGKGVTFEEREDGIHASYRVANTTAGNDLLTEVEEGLRAHLSVEVSDPVITDGVLVGGALTGTGAVVKPAFASAAIYQVTAADCGPKETKDSAMGNLPVDGASGTPVAPVVAPVITAGEGRKEVGNLLHAAFNAGGAQAMNQVMTAALADQLASSDAGKLYVRDQEIGELWKGLLNERPLVESIGVKPLTSLTVVGKVVNRTLAVADWAGGKVELPTGTFSTSSASWNAAAKAVAVDVAAELIEFGGEDVVAEFYTQAMASYVTQTEANLITYLLAQAGVADTTTTSALAAIEKAMTLLGAMGANASFIAVAPDVMAFLRGITSANAPWWLAQQSSVDLRNRQIDLGGLTLVTNSALGTGDMLVGDKRAVDYRESKDIRFRALDVAHGGVDLSFIKFRAQKVTDTGAIIKFTGITGA